ncbi:Thioredoxin reductase [uncultured Roseburia sp.]|uniref:Thioredoxin reductase n=1 Tax=Brotonthovivens ammoniilytica TaxID=2981725 RepID=A0ABT2TM02_9FIRM|nr:thioredoxin-disulfide reductase [Brotonthovivens ammoniilytica]MCU6763249.1 thioredoxin-disulfide reductase [Brotonthovivens ammoniilytica]SCJ10767.1 Thioredoxin reductase [uncultured Roseburia sp.]
MYDVIIIGSGPAGMTAAIYAQRARLNVIVIEKQPMGGGQILNTYEVDNYPGLPLSGGFELGMQFRKHAEASGAEFIQADVTEIQNQDGCILVKTTKGEFQTKAVIAATGARHRTLGVEGEETFSGMGVSYCATCDGAFFRGKTTAVVGGGNVALEDALFLSRNCEKVYLIHRRDELRGEKILQEQIRNTENIEILYSCEVKKIKGEGQVRSLDVYRKKTSDVVDIAVDGVFIAVGIDPNTELYRKLADTDAQGYLVADEDGQTSCPGLFAAGDLRTKQLRQVITAASDGANCVKSVERYLIEQEA